MVWHFLMSSEVAFQEKWKCFGEICWEWEFTGYHMIPEVPPGHPHLRCGFWLSVYRHFRTKCSWKSSQLHSGKDLIWGRFKQDLFNSILETMLICANTSSSSWVTNDGFPLCTHLLQLMATDQSGSFVTLVNSWFFLASLEKIHELTTTKLTQFSNNIDAAVFLGDLYGDKNNRMRRYVSCSVGSFIPSSSSSCWVHILRYIPFIISHILGSQHKTTLETARMSFGSFCWVPERITSSDQVHVCKTFLNLICLGFNGKQTRTFIRGCRRWDSPERTADTGIPPNVNPASTA